MSFVVEPLEVRMLLSAAPQVTAVSPDPLAIVEPAGHVYFTITGANFSLAASGTDYPGGSAKVVLTAPNGGSADEVQDGEITSFSSTSIQLSTTDFTMDGLPPGQWTVQVTNADGTVGNAFAFDVSVSPPPAPPTPTITGIDPDPLVVSGGMGHVLFNLEGSNFNVADGAGDSAVNLTSPNGDTFNLLTDGGGTSSTELAFNTSDFSVEPAGQWTVSVTNEDGTTGNTFAFTVEHTEPTITTQPISQTIASGADVTFSVSATGSAPFSYQWLFDGSSLAGQTAATLTLSSVTVAQAGSYSVVVNNATGQATSDAAVLAVTPATQPPTITTQPQSQAVAEGGSVTFSAGATGSAPLQYQWLFDSNTLAGQTAATLTLSNITPADAGSYAVVVTNSAGSTTSSAAALTVDSVSAAPGLTFTLATKSSTAIAGKKSRIILTVANPTAEKTKQTLSIDLLLSPAGASAQPIPARQLTRHLALKAGKSRSISIRCPLPATADGEYVVSAQVNGVVVGTSAPLAIAPAITHPKR